MIIQWNITSHYHFFHFIIITSVIINHYYYFIHHYHSKFIILKFNSKKFQFKLNNYFIMNPLTPLLSLNDISLDHYRENLLDYGNFPQEGILVSIEWILRGVPFNSHHNSESLTQIFHIKRS